ncbi:DNA polymerase III subunit epsilon [Caulobacter sp. KR2-114]|uniref:DNA polymerase III subunit epsilon n=1 Tax=Caulobacter sp. KR2-114 TaxID=3400912 RepID=UPI003C0B3217
MSREIVLDTETTGLSAKDGHRIIEIACVEVDEAMPTGRHFHVYIDPDRMIDPEAEKVHGISNAFLTGKPRFEHPEIVDQFLEFVGDATLVAHNAAFDRGFINAELERCGRAPLHEGRWVDTLAMAQKKFPGMYNSLDALCKRYKISLAARDKHGALIDASLLASVYLELQGGRERSLDLSQSSSTGPARTAERVAYGARPRPLLSRITDAEREAHLAFLAAELKEKAVWLRYEVVLEIAAEA